MRNSRFGGRFEAAVIVLALLGAAPALRAEDPDAEARNRITEHIRWLSSDKLAGRDTGSEFERLAGDFIAKEFADLGLAPAGEGGTYFQTFEVDGDATIVGAPSLTLTVGPWSRALALDATFVPLGHSDDADFADLPLVFAGYGITDPGKGYDDYAGISVEGKAVLVLRHEPNETRRMGPNAFFETKVRNARAHGAKALLVVTDPRHHEGDESLMPFQGQENGHVFAAQIGQGVAKSLFRLLDQDLAAIQAEIDTTLKPKSFELAARVSANVKIVRETLKARNVIARLPGTDPALSEEIVLIGGHYDHVGYGGANSLAPEALGQIHNGADDNASGTAGVLALAREFAKRPAARTLVFMGFSGEERGLLGSAHFVEHPTLDRSKIVAMLNLDMIGRLEGDPLEIGGVDTAPTFRALAARAAQAEGVPAQLDGTGYGPSDHASFYQAGIPVLFFFTGLHDEYHRPTDDFPTLDLPGTHRVVKVAERCARELADAADRPTYVRLERQRGGRQRALLGVVPAREAAAEGVLLAEVAGGGSAAAAGLAAGDTIVAIAGKDVKDFRSLRAALSERKVGEELEVTYLRAGVRTTVKVTLGRAAE